LQWYGLQHAVSMRIPNCTRCVHEFTRLAVRQSDRFEVSFADHIRECIACRLRPRMPTMRCRLGRGRRVAAPRLSFLRVPTAYGDPRADQRLARDVAGSIDVSGGLVPSCLEAQTRFFDTVGVDAVGTGRGQVIAGAAVRAMGAALIWPAATAWMAESMPRRRHALYMGLFGEFENVGITIGPILGGLAWSLAGIQAAFYTYAVAALLASVIAAVFIKRRADDAIMSSHMGER